jgi:DMSO/TMAO reductase YedYZ heme-binding membrane subunit
MTSGLWWYLARASGLVAWGLVTATVVWGLTLSGHALGRRPRPAWILDLHRHLAGLSLAFTGVHLAALVADGYVHFGPAELLVPLTSRWHPLAVAWGVVGMYLLVGVQVTSVAMRRLPRRAWRAVHRAAVGIFGLVTVHALAAGSEAGNAAVRWFALASLGLVAFLVAFRVLTRRRAKPQVRSARVPERV